MPTPSPSSQPISTTSNANLTSNDIGPGIGIGIPMTPTTEALLLQSFAQSNWAQQNALNTGSTGNININSSHNVASMNRMSGLNGMSSTLESGPMEIDTGFFSTDVQKRFFW
jgi:hypothetical protein